MTIISLWNRLKLNFSSNNSSNYHKNGSCFPCRNLEVEAAGTPPILTVTLLNPSKRSQHRFCTHSHGTLRLSWFESFASLSSVSATKRTRVAKKLAEHNPNLSQQEGTDDLEQWHTRRGSQTNWSLLLGRTILLRHTHTYRDFLR